MLISYNMKEYIRSSATFVNQLLRRKKSVSLFITLSLILILPLFLILAKTSQDIRQHASASQEVAFIDDANNLITQTTQSMVRVALTSPWAVQPNISMSKVPTTNVLGQLAASIQGDASSDDVNEVKGILDDSSKSVWLGTGGPTGASYTGLRFTGVLIPKGAKIISATLQVYSIQDAWISMQFQYAGEKSGTSASFTSTSLPSSRVLTTARVNHSSNVKWKANTAYKLDSITPIIQEIVNGASWQSGNNLSLILKGKGTGYGRKFVSSIDNGLANAPKLLVTFETGSTTPTVTVAATPTTAITSVPPTAIPTIKPTLIPTATSTPTPLPEYTKDIVLAEDAGFTKNVITIAPITANPTYASYTFSNTTVGMKTLYVKFRSTNGTEKVFSSTISLVSNSTPVPSMTMNGESMSMMAWKVGGKNAPNPLYDKCDDGTDVVTAHNQYYVIAYDGIKYPTWHPAVVTNPVTGVGKCYFGHEHGSNPQSYMHWDEIYKFFGKDINGDGVISPLAIAADGKITPGDRAGIPFGMANEHMDQYYNQEGRDSLFVRHEDHVGHKIEFVNSEAEMAGNSTHTMAQLSGTNGVNVPYYNSAANSNTYLPTGVVCTHLHKFHQGTNSADAVRNNLHEVIFHSTCESVNVNNINAPAYYPTNTVLLTGMMAFGEPGGFKRFCFSDRSTNVCPDGKNANGSCVVTDPLISKLPNAVHSDSLGRNMVDKYCLDNFATLNPGVNYFNPYELWEGDLRIQTPAGKMIAEHGRQWDVLDPVRYVDPAGTNGIGYNQDRCNQGLPYSGNCAKGVKGAAWNSPQAAFKGLHRTAYFGRNRVSNNGGSEIWWTDPLGSNAVTTPFTSGLKQRISTVEADIQTVQYRIQQLYGASNFLNDRALQRDFDNGGNTVHAPN